MWALVLIVLPPHGTHPPSKAGIFSMKKAKQMSLYLVQDETATSPFLWCIWNLYQYPHSKDHDQKLWERFLKNIFVVPIQILGKFYLKRNWYRIVCTCTAYDRNRVCRMGSALFFLPLFTLVDARVWGYLRKSEGSLPVKSNYVVKIMRCLWTLPK